MGQKVEDSWPESGRNGGGSQSSRAHFLPQWRPIAQAVADALAGGAGTDEVPPLVVVVVPGEDDVGPVVQTVTHALQAQRLLVGPQNLSRREDLGRSGRPARGF